MVSGTIAPRAPAVIDRWDLDNVINHAQAATFGDYDLWIDRPSHPEQYSSQLEEHSGAIPGESFFLRSIRDDGYRIYDIQR